MKPASISEEELLNLINKLNNDDNVDSLLVQLPLPGEIYIAPFKMISEAWRGLFSLYSWLLMFICLKERGGKSRLSEYVVRYETDLLRIPITP